MTYLQDIWEANSMANAYTPHTCSIEGPYRCEGIECGDNDKGERYDGVCDKDGCDINPYRMGNTNFYGRGPEYAVNTLKPMTVVTEFLTADGTDDGDLSEIRIDVATILITYPVVSFTLVVITTFDTFTAIRPFY
jgi:cellulose 1,4-beta-cellobiosidase